MNAENEGKANYVSLACSCSIWLRLQRQCHRTLTMTMRHMGHIFSLLMSFSFSFKSIFKYTVKVVSGRVRTSTYARLFELTWEHLKNCKSQVDIVCWNVGNSVTGTSMIRGSQCLPSSDILLSFLFILSTARRKKIRNCYNFVTNCCCNAKLLLLQLSENIKKNACLK